MDLIWSPGILLLIAQIACVVHLVRHDRSWLWLLALILVPFIGVLAYVLVEVLPGLQGSRSHDSGLKGEESPRISIRELETELEKSPTVENRARLARACLRKHKTDRAIRLYEECLHGVYADDLTLWYELAEAYHAAGKSEETLAALDRLERDGYHDYQRRRALLRALAFEGVGRREEARNQLEELAVKHPSVQAQYEYARLLLELGEKEKAQAIVHQIFDERSRHDRRYRQREAQWYQKARKLPVE